MDSILESIKKMLGGAEHDDHFDTDLIIHINSVFAILSQMGIRPEGFSIHGREETWEDFISDEDYDLQDVKTYIYMKVKLLFDPPTSSAALDSFNRLTSEFEWRLNVAGDKTYLE